MTGAPSLNPMSALNIVFSKLEQFTGDGGFDWRQWIHSFERSCVIVGKDDDLVKGQILMMCIDGRAKAILDQFEAEKGSPQKYTTLKAQLSTAFDSPADREAHTTVHMQRALIKLVEICKKTLDNKGFVGAVLMDLYRRM